MSTPSPGANEVALGKLPLRGLTDNLSGFESKEYSKCKVESAKSGVGGVAPISYDKRDPSTANFFANELFTVSGIFLVFIN